MKLFTFGSQQIDQHLQDGKKTAFPFLRPKRKRAIGSQSKISSQRLRKENLNLLVNSKIARPTPSPRSIVQEPLHQVTFYQKNNCIQKSQQLPNTLKKQSLPKVFKTSLSTSKKTKMRKRISSLETKNNQTEGKVRPFMAQSKRYTLEQDQSVSPLFDQQKSRKKGSQGKMKTLSYNQSRMINRLEKFKSAHRNFYDQCYYEDIITSLRAQSKVQSSNQNHNPLYKLRNKRENFQRFPQEITFAIK